MIDINIPLRTAYVAALGPLGYNGPVHVYYQNAPDDIDDQYYVIMSPVVSVGDNDKGFNQSQTSMQLTVVSWGEKYNDGQGCDDIAGQILNIILPTPQAKMDLSAGYNTQINLVSDNTIQFKVQNQRNYINRILIFRHQILN